MLPVMVYGGVISVMFVLDANGSIGLAVVGFICFLCLWFAGVDVIILTLS